ncbi:putative Fe-Mo cluster-binding NifX family protein [Natranaerovirga pectinivora]|uniref:Putative Fe-Mo cluster-binding NifX family protein n=1 Tax=Natranaerovirga pectinivora TaxID=682400 RepID=A0A4R3MMY0_9FIRM|nr:NifB/NifX family molybdenum-iron cluster-binding protein [Natranaerovirga pectinivora]TCT15384.1 putative Fe-Mo cluster-binding NifX family protein [Natranaerovirga pectinivora]
MKIAIASTDGKVINAHFGRTPQFLIFEIVDKEFILVDVRMNQPACSNLVHPKGTMEDTMELISDCSYVIASQIGPGMIEKLKEKNIVGVINPNFIQVGMEELLLQIT